MLIEPRAQWPGGMLSLGIDLRGSIPVADRLEPGRALARLSGPSWTGPSWTEPDWTEPDWTGPDWTEPDWGGPLRELFAADAPDTEASPAMMQACFRVLADWDWEMRPVAVVSMPSRRRPRLVASVARAISRAGRMPLIGEVDVVEPGPSGGTSGPRAGAGGTAGRASGGSDIEPSAYRLAGVYDRFAVGEQLADGLAAVAGHPILLVDDIVDTRWSITEAGRILRRNGAHQVLPYALALRG
ncbi:MAG: hypothetical protein ACSLE3_12100 [Microbacteriaceae bacterium]